MLLRNAYMHPYLHARMYVCVRAWVRCMSLLGTIVAHTHRTDYVVLATCDTLPAVISLTMV